MHRLATLIALVLVVAAVSAGISSHSSAVLILATVLMATGVLAYKFVHRALAANAGVKVSTFREFLGCLVQNLFRFGIGAVVIAWMAVSALWFFGQR
jgi:hypothetical protein